MSVGGGSVREHGSQGPILFFPENILFMGPPWLLMELTNEMGPH